MKIKKIMLLMLLLVAATGYVRAQESDRYVFVISKINYLKAIDDAVSESRDAGLEISEIRVILCGESVKAFDEDHPLIRKAMAQKKIRLYACGLSLEQMKLDPKILPRGVEVVKNGLLEAMVLERKGFRTFDL